MPFKMSYLPAAALILSGSPLCAGTPGSAVGPPVVQSEITPGSAQALELLREIKSIAQELTRDTATLESYNFRGLSWQSHAHQLTVAKEHINAIGERLQKLQAIRNTAAPWQRQAIDAMIPAAMEVASRTEKAIQHVNENQWHLFAPMYTDHLRTIAENSNQIKQTVNLFLEFARTQEKLDDLHGRVGAAIQS